MWETWSNTESEAMLLQWGALPPPPPPPPHPSVEDLLVRGWGVFSLQGHIPLNRLPSFSFLLHPLSPLFLCSTSCFPHVQLSPSHQPLFYFDSLIYSHFLPNNSAFHFSHSYLFSPPFYPCCSSSSPRDLAPFQSCIIRPKHKPAQAHIWKEFGHGSFLPRRLNI